MTRVNGFAAEGKSSPDQHQDYRRIVLRSLGKSLIMPLLVFAFFLFAPAWLNYKVHSQLDQLIQASTELSPSQKAERIESLKRIDFAAVALADPCPLEFQKVRAFLDEDEITPTFQRLCWGQYLSYALVGLLAFAAIAVTVLNAKAKRSQADLIRAYQLSWHLSMAVAIAKVFLLIPLLGYGVFEFTVLLSNHFFPKLLILIVGGGLWALWKCVSILLTNVPLTFKEPMARSVTEQEAPELWRVVRAAAQRLQAEPPDHILVGMQLNFYVTELAVEHDSGVANGRTLYLSYPVLKMLSADEITAIIGHELGHFIGQDTRMTREFYPLKFKIHGTMVALAGSGWAAWPSLEFLGYFANSFEETTQTASRKRELLADQIGATLTSPQTQARALVRFQIMIEAFDRGVAENLRLGAANPLDVPVQSVIRSQFLPESKFWAELFDQKIPHPLDSHPSLQVRLDGLGQLIDATAAQKLALEEPDSAYAHWFPNHEHLFTDLTQQAHVALAKVQTRKEVAKADLTTAEGKELLVRHFPTVSWTIRPFAFWMPLALIVIISGVIAIPIFLAENTPAFFFLGGIILFCVPIATGQWIRHRHGKFTLNAAGMSYTGWKRPLRFEEITLVSFTNANGAVNLLIHLKEKQPSIWKFSFVPWGSKKVTFSLSNLNGKPPIIARTVYRYFARELEEAAAEAIV